MTSEWNAVRTEDVANHMPFPSPRIVPSTFITRCQIQLVEGQDQG